MFVRRLRVFQDSKFIACKWTLLVFGDLLSEGPDDQFGSDREELSSFPKLQTVVKSLVPFVVCTHVLLKQSTRVVRWPR